MREIVVTDNPADDAILRLLRKAPERWEEVDSDTLTATEQEALKLLTGAGLVERKFSIRLSLIGHPVRIDVTATATGEHGFVQAMEPVLRKTWNVWAEFYRAHRDGPEEDRPKVFCEKTGPEMWRLTGDGEKARHDVQSGNAAMTLDFVGRGIVYAGRPAVRGHGRAERINETRQADVPSKVEVTNLGELSGLIKDMIAAFQNGLERMAAAAPQTPQESTEPAKTENPKCGKRGPDRMPLEQAWRYPSIVQEWFGIRERNQKLPMRDRYQKVQLAEKHGITKKKLDAMLGWYAKHRTQKRFPDDPRTLSKGELKQWFE